MLLLTMTSNVHNGIWLSIRDVLPDLGRNENIPLQAQRSLLPQY